LSSVSGKFRHETLNHTTLFSYDRLFVIRLNPFERSRTINAVSSVSAVYVLHIPARRTAFFHDCFLQPVWPQCKPEILLLKLRGRASLTSGTRFAIRRGCASTCCWNVAERRSSVAKRHDGRTERPTHVATSPTPQLCKLVYLQVTSNKALWPKLVKFISIALGKKRSLYSGGTVERIGRQ